MSTTLDALALRDDTGVLEITHPDLQDVEVIVGPQSKLGFVHGLDEKTWLASVAFAALEMDTHQRAVDKYQFVLGDLMLRGEQALGEDAYAKAAAATGKQPETLRHYAWVAKRVPAVVRTTALTFNHHRQVAKLSSGAQMAWLARAEAEGLSVVDLKKAIRAAMPAKRIPPTQPGGDPGAMHQITINLNEEAYAAFCEMAQAEGYTAGAMLEKLALDSLEASLYVQQGGAA